MGSRFRNYAARRKEEEERRREREKRKNWRKQIPRISQLDLVSPYGRVQLTNGQDEKKKKQ